MIDLNLKPVLSKHFRLQWEPVQDSFVLLYPEGMVKLNQSAADILRACDGERSVADICSELQQRYPDAGDITQDVGEFFLGASDHGWTRFV